MSPASEEVAGAVVVGDALDGVAVTDPPEKDAPDVTTDDGECPPASGDLSHKGVVAAFFFRAAARGREDRLESDRGEGFVELNRGWVAVGEEGNGGLGGFSVFWLHEDEGHAVLAPVGFEEEGEGAVVAFEEWVGQEGCLEVIKGGLEGGGPLFVRDGFAVELADHVPEWSGADLKVGDEPGIKVEEANKGVEGGAMVGEGPVPDGVVLGRGRAVAFWPEVKANPLHSLQKEVAFLWVEGESPLGEDVADTFKVEEEGPGIVAEEEDVVDDLPVSTLNQGSSDRVQLELREPFAEEGLPFLSHEEHEGTVAGRAVEGAEGHDIESEELVIGSREAELLLIRLANCNLMEAGLGIHTDPEEMAGTGGKVVNGLVTPGDGEAVGECNGIEAAIVDTQAPDEVDNVLDVLLMGFGGEDNLG